MTAELVLGLKRRDRAAFEELLAQHGPTIYRIARRVIGNRHDAEDVLQESLLTVMAKIDTLEDPWALGAWLRRVAVNNALMRLRSRRREPDLEPELHEPVFTPEGNHALRSYEWPPSPEGELLRRELREHLDEAVSRLPEGARAVYVLAEIEGLGYGEVADLLGISKGAVRVRLHRARLMLRDVLDRYLAGRASGLIRDRRPGGGRQP